MNLARRSPGNRLERIAALSATARTTWFGLLALLAFVAVTLMAHKDADFFARGAVTELPLIGIDVPTKLFFPAASGLLAAVYAYFHLYLMSLWDELAGEEAFVGGRPLADQTYPWLLGQSVLWIRNRLRQDESSPPRAMGIIATFIAIFLTWIASPAALATLWVRSWPLHDKWLSYAILVSFVAAVFVGTATFWVAIRLMSKDPRERAHRTQPILLLALFVGVWWAEDLSWQKTEGPGLRPFIEWLASERGVAFPPGCLNTATNDKQIASKNGVATPGCRSDPLVPTSKEFEAYRKLVGSSAVASATLREASLTPRPSDWKPFLIWLADLRQVDLLGPKDDPLIPTSDEMARWRLAMDALGGPPMSLADLRRADLYDAFLPGADLRGANLADADLRSANLAGANLNCRPAEPGGEAEVCTQMQGADLGGAQMQGADLSLAHMQGAELGGAQMQGADLGGAQMQGADLSWAQMQGAGLSWAQMQGADLSWAQMQGADLSWAQMQGAILREASLEGAECADASLGGASAHSARLLCKNLTQAQLDLVLGDAETVLPEHLYVWSCWEEPPDTFQLLETGAERFGISETELWEQFICTEKNPRRRYPAAEHPGLR